MKLNNNDKKLFEVSEKVIEKLKEKYNKYDKYLDYKFYNDLKIKLPTYYNYGINIAPDIYFKLIANNLIIKELSKLTSKGNSDIEIDFIEKYKNILRWIMSKKHIKDEIYNEQAEDILSYAIKTYSSSESKTFLIHIYNCVKEKLSDKIDDDTIDKKLDRYFDKNEIEPRKPEYLELVAHELDIINYISKSDKMLNQFIYLKYGYYLDTYFNLSEISEILNIEMDKVNNYYKDSLIVLGDVVDLYLEEQYDEKIVYAKKLLDNKKTPIF